MKDFLERYPADGPDAGTGPRSRALCECGHPIRSHHQLGPCISIAQVRVGVASPRYCSCTDYRQAAER